MRFTKVPLTSMGVRGLTHFVNLVFMAKLLTNIGMESQAFMHKKCCTHKLVCVRMCVFVFFGHRFEGSFENLALKM